VASWRDEIKQSVNTVVAESGVTFDAGLFSQNIVVLPFEVANNLTEAEWVKCQSLESRVIELL